MIIPEVIAEAGTSHGGDLGRARELIQAAAEGGAQTVKFQYVLAREIIHPLTGEVPLPGGSLSLYERFEALERPPEFYAALKEACEKQKVRFLCTPFGPESLARLREIGLERIKIASPELNHLPLLEEAAAAGLPLLLSTGVSRLTDIEEAFTRVPRGKVTLFHCITSYPAPEEEYNLRLIPALSQIFGCPVGISDHSRDPLLVPLTAAALGATAIEKHITLSRRDSGLDDPIALEPKELAALTAELARHGGEEPAKLLSGLEKEWGRDRIHKLLGTGRKELAPSERPHYGRTNRSLHIMQDLPAGHRLRPEDVALLRTEKVLRPGLHPRYLPLVLGKFLSRAVPAGEGLLWEDLLSAD